MPPNDCPPFTSNTNEVILQQRNNSDRLEAGRLQIRLKTTESELLKTRRVSG